MKLNTYELVLETLKSEANVKSIDEFVEVFHSQEQINSEMFARSNALNEEVLPFPNSSLFAHPSPKLEALEKELSLVNSELKRLPSQQGEGREPMPEEQSQAHVRSSSPKINESL